MQAHISLAYIHTAATFYETSDGRRKLSTALLESTGTWRLIGRERGYDLLKNSTFWLHKASMNSKRSCLPLFRRNPDKCPPFQGVHQSGSREYKIILFHLHHRGIWIFLNGPSILQSSSLGITPPPHPEMFNQRSNRWMVKAWHHYLRCSLVLLAYLFSQMERIQLDWY